MWNHVWSVWRKSCFKYKKLDTDPLNRCLMNLLTGWISQKCVQVQHALIAIHNYFAIWQIVGRFRTNQIIHIHRKSHKTVMFCHEIRLAGSHFTQDKKIAIKIIYLFVFIGDSHYHNTFFFFFFAHYCNKNAISMNACKNAWE